MAQKVRYVMQGRFLSVAPDFAAMQFLPVIKSDNCFACDSVDNGGSGGSCNCDCDSCDCDTSND